MCFIMPRLVAASVVNKLPGHGESRSYDVCYGVAQLFICVAHFMARFLRLPFFKDTQAHYLFRGPFS